ncbi:MAG: NAD(+) diphosphatase [Myxococcales bacterium]|nr:NAD(+) diphosphatase [Myxococcales bacterium]
MPEPLPALDRAAALRSDIDRLETQLSAPDTLLMPLWRTQNLLREDAPLLLPISEAGALLDGAAELVWLGKLGGRGCFALDISPLPDPLTRPPLAGLGADFRDLRAAGERLSPDAIALCAYAKAILHWHSRHAHCAVCGGPTAPRQGGHMRRCRDEACSAEHFPRTDPAIIVLVERGDLCLLGRQARWPRGMYSTLAGFVEPGETMEQAVAREVFEEAGVRIGEPRYVRSQPWPFPASLMIGFRAPALSEEIALGDDELEDARWFHREQLLAAQRDGQDPETGERLFFPGGFSLAGQLIGSFLQKAEKSGGT